jgi:hypothetical protein
MWGHPAPPPHVSIILDGAVRLEGLTRELREAVAQRGLYVTRDFWSGPEIRFDPLPADVAANDELVRILTTLAALGFAFLTDHRQGWCPEDVLLHLRERGLFQGPFLACGFDGSRWHVREVAAAPG